jgi:hypothetical protein
MKIKTNLRAGSGGSKSQTQTSSGGSVVYVPPVILARCLGVV